MLTLKNKKYFLIGLAVLVLAGLAALLIINSNTNRSKNALSSSVDDLKTTNKKLRDENKTLTARNENLRKAVTTQQTQAEQKVTAVSSQEVSGTTEAAFETNKPKPKPAASLVVTAVKDQSTQDFALHNQTLQAVNVHAVYITLTNLSSSQQNYTTHDFKAINAKGEVISPTFYAPYDASIYFSKDLLPNGSTDVVVCFPRDQNVTTLRWTLPNNSTQLFATLP